MQTLAECLGRLQDLVLSATALPVRRILTVGYLFSVSCDITYALWVFVSFSYDIAYALWVFVSDLWIFVSEKQISYNFTLPLFGYKEKQTLLVS